MANEKRLIDADMLKANFPVLGEFAKDLWHASTIRSAIEDAPTVDAVEVVHGRWEKHLAPYTDDYWTCTCCNGNFMTDAAQYWHYCPNCGADMRERKDDG